MDVPQLLVSVRTTQEAVSAVRGGADILDVKEPAAGPLGMASMATVREISGTVAALSAPPPISIALGELRDWFHASTPNVATPDIPSLARLLSDLPSIQFLKCGLSGCQHSAAWESEWAQLRAAAGPEKAWVAVAYADADRAEAPSVQQVLTAATACRASAVLIDTFVKDQTCLLDWLAPERLMQLRDQCRRSGLLLALAGRISAADIPVLKQVGADVIAVRGAACEEANRLQTVSQHRVQLLSQALRSNT